MKNNSTNKYLFCFTFVLITSCSIFSGTTFDGVYLNDSIPTHKQPEVKKTTPEIEPTVSSTDNYDTIESIFAQKLLDYAQFGYFPQYYEPSLQATYYALYILEALGKLEQIDQGKVLDYIMSNYNAETQIFMDAYSYRYLDTIFDYGLYHPYTSVLEVNCYAILSLEILNRLNMIDTQHAIDFIWSCFNPEGTENGFIGRPYDPTLSYGFKTAMMDNSFFAITTLDLLANDWGGHDSELTSLVNFINGLQEADPNHFDFGGFYNEHNSSIYSSFESLAIHGHGNILASYYNLKTLDMLNLLDTIQINNFHQHLTNLYDDTTNYFRMYVWQDYDQNIVGTALALDLADLTGFTDFNQNAVLSFILSNRNAIGNWDVSTEYHYHELIDTFQIVRSLKESGVLNQLSPQEKSQVANSLKLYQQFKGYSLLSHDYMSLDLIYTVVNAFSLFGRVSDLDISGLYNTIAYNYKGYAPFRIYGFVAFSNIQDNYIGFRSHPIEYYSLGEHTHTNFTDGLYDHKRNYMALDSLLKMYKLDDFHNQFGLMNIFDNIIDSQFLEPDFDNYGAFLLFRNVGSPELQNKLAFFEYSYYAIKTLELIAEYLNLGALVTLPFNKVALHQYIEKNIVETNSTLYFNPQFTTDPYITLKYTYYMAYVLKALNLLSINLDKLTRFVLDNIDYDNVLKLYYCYKISDLLGLNIEFDLESAQALVRNMFSPEYHEFFIDSNFQELDQKSFLWVCDLAVNSEFVVESDYQDSIVLGGVNTITTSFCNMIFPEYGTDIVVKFESPTLGSIPLDRLSNTTYQANIMVPEEPQNFPYINGSLKAFKNTAVIGEAPIFFYTSLNQIVTPFYKFEGNKIWFEINITRALVSGDHSVSNSFLFVDVYKENTHLNTLQLHRKHFANYSTFTFNHEVENAGTYTYNFTIADEYYPNGCCILSIQHAFSPPDLLSIEMNGFLLATIGLAGNTAVVGSIVIVGNRIKRKRSRKAEVKESANIEQDQGKIANRVNENIEQDFFEKWS